MKSKDRILILFFVIFLSTANIAYAYIGPGAGFAFLGSSLVFVGAILLSILTIFLWPVQVLFQKLKCKKVGKKARAKRVVVVGLDGLDPKLFEEYSNKGWMPNLTKLRDSGFYSRLGTTIPSLSPVAWSTFQTGVNPGAHNIFDFLTRDKRYCLPELSSTRTLMQKQSSFFGPFKKNRLVPKVELLRKSKPFWSLLGNYGIPANILRVPISYPPEPFDGNILSAMCTPDLKGTQGSFTLFQSDIKTHNSGTIGGQVRALTESNGSFDGSVDGPPSAQGGFITAKFKFTPNYPDSGILEILDAKYQLKLEQLSDWIELEFISGKDRVSGIVKFCLRELTPNKISLYVSPVNINPMKPALPISHPSIFAPWLARLIGPFGTLGLLEDTWARNELALDDQKFLDQAYSVHDEREKMFFEVLDRSSKGLFTCVFDASDRIQHMFWRYIDKNHPSPLEDQKFANTIPEMYKKMDALVGKVQGKLDKKDCLIVLSDHGFSSFRRCVGVNKWLYDNGYLCVKNGVTGADYFADVDWTRTKAFGLGLTGIYINLKGREINGIVDEHEAEILLKEISSKLESLTCPNTHERAINKVYLSKDTYKGLYTGDSPDLILGYSPGYRVSWDSITGVIENEVFSDNIKAWSGDHHVDPPLVPGVLFSNFTLKNNPSIIDLAPTILEIFGINAPRYMEGRSLLS